MSFLLNDAIAAFLDSASERALDEPLMALLRADGYSHVSRNHGSQEFGRDIVARKGGEQWAFQSKRGKLGQQAWRDIEGQINELRLEDFVGPEFDLDIPRRPVLVISGRLVGNAPQLVKSYNQRAEGRGEPTVEVWNRDELLSRFVGNPDAVMRGSTDGALLSLLGSISAKDVTHDSIEQFSRRWETFEPDRLAGLGVIEAALVCENLSEADRLDLACHAALCFVRAAWAGPGESEDAQAAAAADAGGALFDTYAEALWRACAEDPRLREDKLAGCGGPEAWVTYPVRCVRTIELLGLLAIRLELRSDPRSAEIAAWIAAFVANQPGATHPISDRFAVSFIPVATVLAIYEPDAAHSLLHRLTVWICDRYDRGQPGLAGLGESAESEISRLFGDSFEHLPEMSKRTTSVIAAVCLDLAAVFGYRKLYADIRNDFLAVRLTPAVLRCSDDTNQYVLEGRNHWEHNPQYPEELPASGLLNLHHHTDDYVDRALRRAGRSWDLFAVSSALRDRYFLGAAMDAFGQRKALPEG